MKMFSFILFILLNLYMFRVIFNFHNQTVLFTFLPFLITMYTMIRYFNFLLFFLLFFTTMDTFLLNFIIINMLSMLRRMNINFCVLNSLTFFKRTQFSMIFFTTLRISITPMNYTHMIFILLHQIMFRYIFLLLLLLLLILIIINLILTKKFIHCDSFLRFLFFHSHLSSRSSTITIQSLRTHRILLM